MKHKKIICIGDSLTAGYGVTINQRWSTLLEEDLSMEIVNSGISGDTTAGMLARFYETAIRHKPDYIIVTGGTNDIWLNLSDNTIIGNILAMTRHAKYYDVTPIIGIPTPFHNLGDFNDTSPFHSTSSFCNRLNTFRKILA